MITAEELYQKIVSYVNKGYGYDGEGMIGYIGDSRYGTSYYSTTNGWPWKHLFNGTDEVTVPGLGKFNVIEKWKDQEDPQGYTGDEERWLVFEVSDHPDQMFRTKGWRDSWDEYFHNDGPVEEVEPYEKTVTAYRIKKSALETVTGDEVFVNLVGGALEVNGMQLSFSDYNVMAHSLKNDKVVIPYLGQVFLVDSELDYEYDSRLSIVVKVGDRFFRKTGYYDSYDGEVWDSEATEVVETTKVYKVWEAK